MKVRLEVARQSPSGEQSTARYEVEAELNASVLDCLERIALTQDPTLAFRDNCTVGVCGECGLRVNGQERLGCQVRVSELPVRGAIASVTIEPLRHHRVIRDLVVERQGHFSRVLAANALFKQGNEPERVDDTLMQRVRKTTACIHCGLCVSACESYPSHPDFVGPAALAWTARFLSDPRDGGTEARRALVASPMGTAGCVDCGQCDPVCPEGVEPYQAIRGLR